MSDGGLEGRAGDFHAAMERGIETLKREVGYNATRWRRMVYDHGGVGAAKRLLGGPDASDGFTKLWESGRLDMSVEWFVLKFDDLFTDEERETAYRRLKLYDAPVDTWLRDQLGRRWP